MHLFHPAVAELYPFIINRYSIKENVSLTALSHSSKLIKPKEGVVGISNP